MASQIALVRVLVIIVIYSRRSLPPSASNISPFLTTLPLALLFLLLANNPLIFLPLFPRSALLTNPPLKNTPKPLHRTQLIPDLNHPLQLPVERVYLGEDVFEGGRNLREEGLPAGEEGGGVGGGGLGGRGC